MIPKTTTRGLSGKKVLFGLPLAAALLATPLLAPYATAAPVQTAAASSGPAALAGGTISTERQTATSSYWTAERMKGAKPAMPVVKKTAATASVAPNSSYSGTPVTVSPTTGKRAPVTATSPDVSLAIHSRAYAYPAPFTRHETFPASSYKVFPNRTVGKLFFSDGVGNNFVCSASVVNSENKDIVWTAGHCLSNGAGTFYRNWAFVPARRLGANPLGVWTPREFWTLSEWHSFGNLRQDVGALVMNDNANGTSIANSIGALGIQFNAPRLRHWTAMGYPAASPFSGERQYQNHASYAASDTPSSRPGPDTLAMGNDLTGGSSGGPWIVGHGPGGGWVNGVNSYKYISPSMPLEMYSPYFGNEALSLFNHVRGR